jgi:hypothetical protein
VDAEMSFSGVSGMVRAAIWLECQLDLEILGIGRGGLDCKESCTLEAAGKHLSYTIVLDAGFIFLRAQLLDSCDPSEELMSVGDTKPGWETICRVVGGLERNAIKSLERPIELGEGGPNSWVIA